MTDLQQHQENKWPVKVRPPLIIVKSFFFDGRSTVWSDSGKHAS